MLKGVSGSPGYGSGIAVVLRDGLRELKKHSGCDHEREVERFRDAQAAYSKQLDMLIQNPGAAGETAIEILNAYKAILHDEAFFKKALERSKSERMNMEYAIRSECSAVVAQFEALDDPYMRERAADIENVCNEIIRRMLGIEQNFNLPSELSDVIVVAPDLSPAETIKMDKTVLRGLVTEKGGATSHTVILAKALGIPAITGVKNAVDTVKDGDYLLLDAYAGTVTINPEARQQEGFLSFAKRFNERQSEYAEGSSKPAVTLDGHKVDININAGDSMSVEAFNADTCDGVGLLRTEFMYMERNDYPDEGTQYELYGKLAERACGKEVIIRTLDIGGDKRIDYMNLPVEDNPFLGCRAIRFCFDRRDVFHTQLRAILRASVRGNVKIMFPMIVSIEELREAKDCVERAKESLLKEGVRFNDSIPVGIMVETPAAALISDQLAREADFFSIGSNDLIGYITATDRMNEKVHYLYNSANNAVLRAIRMAAENACAAGIPWGICGEAASEDRLIPMWVGLGVSELSVAPYAVGRVKHLIRQMNRAKLLPKIMEILDLRTSGEIRQALDGILAQIENGGGADCAF